jgi:hypothetical protein
MWVGNVACGWVMWLGNVGGWVGGWVGSVGPKIFHGLGVLPPPPLRPLMHANANAKLSNYLKPANKNLHQN